MTRIPLISRRSYLPAGAVRFADRHSDAVAYLYEADGRPCAQLWLGDALEPAQAFAYVDAAQREADLARAFVLRQLALLQK